MWKERNRDRYDRQGRSNLGEMNICGSSTGGFTTVEVRAEEIIALSSRRSDDETCCSRTPATTCPSCGHPVDLYGQVSVMVGFTGLCLWHV